jgi:uncharacterized membrane protein
MEVSFMTKFDDSRFFDPHRLKDISDAIFAFAMTFLIVTIDIPRMSAGMIKAELINKVPDILTYVLSFFLLAIFWMTNHIQMKNVKRADSRLVWINMLLLLFIVFVPLTTDLYAIYDYSRSAMLAFNLNMCLVGFVFMLQWHHLAANSMHHEEFTKGEISERYSVCRMLIETSFVAIVMGMFYPAWSPLAYIIMASSQMYLRFKWIKKEESLPGRD